MNSNQDTQHLNLDNFQLLNELGTLAYKKNIPLFTTLELTQDCNLSCGHCYNFDRSKTKKAPSLEKSLSTAEWINVIDQIVEQGAFYICFTGGEVLLYPSLWELVDRANSKGCLVKLKTNGTALNDENVERLLRHKVSALEISLYGMSEESYQKFTGKNGMYLKVRQGLERLTGQGISVVLNFILNTYNVHEVPLMVAYAEELSLQFNFSDEITKRYDQTDSSLDYNLTNDQYNELLKGPYSSYFLVKHDLSSHSFQCSCARNVCGIGQSGDIYPCIGAPIKAGNIREDSFQSVWNESALFNEIRNLKQDNFKECIKCELAEYCNRSSGSAYVNANDYYGCDSTSHRLAEIRKLHVTESSQ